MDSESHRPSTRDWLVRSAVMVVAVSVTAALVFPLVGLGSWLHAGLLAAAISGTGALFTRAPTR